MIVYAVLGNGEGINGIGLGVLLVTGQLFVGTAVPGLLEYGDFYI